MPRETMAAKRERAAEIEKRMFDHYGAGACSLDYECDPFRLLVAVVLSAQCTDAAVNKVTPSLFAAYPTPAALAQANVTLATKERYEKCLNKKTLIENEINRLKSSILTPKETTNNALEALGSMKLKTAVSLYDLIKRPELDYEIIKDLDTTREPLDREIQMQVQTMIKYEGYIEKQSQQIEAFKKLENKKLENIDYNSLSGLRIEAVQKLAKFRPETVGQASRISGVSPADINVLLIHLETQRRKNG